MKAILMTLIEIWIVAVMISAFRANEVQPASDITYWFQALLVLCIFACSGYFFAKYYRKEVAETTMEFDAKPEISDLAVNTYIEYGYFSRGSFSAQYVRQHLFDVTFDAIDKALQEMVDTGQLIAHPERGETLYSLPTLRQAELIDIFDLRTQWAEYGPMTTTSHPFISEVSRVQSASKNFSA